VSSHQLHCGNGLSCSCTSDSECSRFCWSEMARMAESGICHWLGLCVSASCSQPCVQSNIDTAPRCFCIPATCCGQTSGTDTATFLLALTHVQRDLLLAWSCIWCLLFWTWIMPLFSKPVRTAKKAGLANTNLTHISFLPTHEYGASWLLVDQLAPICQHTCADVC